MKRFYLAEHKLNNSITTCFEKAKRLLDDADVPISNEGNLSTALGLYTFVVVGVCNAIPSNTYQFNVQECNIVVHCLYANIVKLT